MACAIGVLTCRCRASRCSFCLLVFPRRPLFTCCGKRGLRLFSLVFNLREQLKKFVHSPSQMLISNSSTRPPSLILINSRECLSTSRQSTLPTDPTIWMPLYCTHLEPQVFRSPFSTHKPMFCCMRHVIGFLRQRIHFDLMFPHYHFITSVFLLHDKALVTHRSNRALVS